VWCEALEELSDASPRILDGAFLSFAQESLQLGEDLLDRIEVGGIGRQEEELGASGAYGGADGPAFVAAQIVHDDDVTWLEGRDQELADVGQEACAVDRTVEDAGSGDAVVSQGCQEGQRLPVPVKHFGRQRCAALGPAMSVYLEPEVMKALATHAARRDQSGSLTAEAAITSFLSPDAAERQEAATTKRLDQLDRRMTRTERDLGISVEMLAVFVRFWLTTNPPLREPAEAAARARTGERYDAFVAALGRRLAKGPKLRQEISEDINSVPDGQ